MADKKPKKGSIADRWNSEVPEQFETEDASKEDLERIKELQRTLNKEFRDYVNGKK